MRRWNYRLLPKLSWVQQGGRPDKQTQNAIGEVCRWYTRTRGVMAVPDDVAGATIWLYGTDEQPERAEAVGHACRGRVSLLYTPAEWAELEDDWAQMPEDAMKADFRYDVFESRQHLATQIQVSWERLRADWHQKAKLALVDHMVRAGVVEEPREELTLQDNQWTAFVDGGGETKEMEPEDVISGAYGWGVRAPGGPTLLTGLGPLCVLGAPGTPQVDADMFPTEMPDGPEEGADGEMMIPAEALPNMGVNEPKSSTAEMYAVLKLYQCLWMLRGWTRSVVKDILESGELTVTYDNKLGLQLGKGEWSSRKEPALWLELRRGDWLLQLLGLGVQGFWQKSHKRNTRHWIIRGNRDIDGVVTRARAWGRHLAAHASVDLGAPAGNGPTWCFSTLTAEHRRVLQLAQLEGLFGPGESFDRGLIWDPADLRTVHQIAQGDERFRSCQRVLAGDRPLLQVQRRLLAVLKGAAWHRGTSWRSAEAKIANRWGGRNVTLWEFRWGIAKIKALLPKVRYSRIDLLHNAWATAGRQRRALPNLDKIRWLPMEKQEALRQKYDKVKEHNDGWATVGCAYCRGEGLGRAEHYFADEDPGGHAGCPKVTVWAQQLGLLEGDERPTLRWVLSLDGALTYKVARERTKFLHALWRILDWRNRRREAERPELSANEQETAWGMALQTANTSYASQMRKERKRVLKATRRRSAQLRKQRRRGHDQARAAEAELIVWALPDLTAEQVEYMRGELEEQEASMRPRPSYLGGGWEVVGRRGLLHALIKGWDLPFPPEDYRTESYVQSCQHIGREYLCVWRYGLHFKGIKNWRKKKRDHELHGCLQGAFLAYGLLLRQDCRRGRRQQEEPNEDGGKVITRLGPLEMEEDIFCMHLTSAQAEQSLGLGLGEVHARWLERGDLQVEWDHDLEVVMASGTKDRIVELHRGLGPLAAVKFGNGTLGAPQVENTGNKEQVAAPDSANDEPAPKTRRLGKDRFQDDMHRRWWLLRQGSSRRSVSFAREGSGGHSATSRNTKLRTKTNTKPCWGGKRMKMRTSACGRLSDPCRRRMGRSRKVQKGRHLRKTTRRRSKEESLKIRGGTRRTSAGSRRRRHGRLRGLLQHCFTWGGPQMSPRSRIARGPPGYRGSCKMVEADV